MGENLDQHEIKPQVKKRNKREKKGRIIGAELLNGEKIIGILEESRPNVLLIRDQKTGDIKDIHRAIIKRFMLRIEGGIE
jgi:hypothetical protein